MREVQDPWSLWPLPSDEITSRETRCITLCSAAGCDRQDDVPLEDFETQFRLGLNSSLSVSSSLHLSPVFRTTSLVRQDCFFLSVIHVSVYNLPSAEGIQCLWILLSMQMIMISCRGNNLWVNQYLMPTWTSKGHSFMFYRALAWNLCGQPLRALQHKSVFNVFCQTNFKNRRPDNLL